MNSITFMTNSMESAVYGTKMGNYGGKIITLKTKNMESAVDGIEMGNFIS